jgi:hypothetical protein
MNMWPFSISLALLALQASAKLYEIPDSVYGGPVTVEYESQDGNFDGQKISPGPNDTSYDWSVNLSLTEQHSL